LGEYLFGGVPVWGSTCLGEYLFGGVSILGHHPQLTAKAKKKPARVPAFEQLVAMLIAWRIEGVVAPCAGLPFCVRLLLRLA